ncbi:MAG TPA: 5-oxoprolinase, partial [Bacteroidetes bacterium]|nr:5-oxoprolinase [Bacteroidota bacterium]
MQKREWQIWVDTGGTFTDCLALDPEGNLHRAKVLSSSALRGKVVRAASARELHVDAGTGLPSGFLEGFSFRILGSGHPPIQIARHDAATGRITLAKELTTIPQSGDAFEALSPEEAPVLAARMVMGVPLGQPLPP